MTNRPPTDRELLESVIESAEAIIFSVDRDIRYTAFNRAHADVMRAIYGVEIRIGGRFADFMRIPADRETALRNIDRALAGESFVVDEFSGDESLARPHFEIRHCPVRDRDGGILGATVIARDVTERRRMETRLAAAQKLESIGGLAGGVAHDFNNLLSPILGFAEMAGDELAPDDPRRAPLDQIVKAATRAGDLVRQLLAFARRQVLNVQPIDLNRTIDGFRPLLRRTIREETRIDFRPGPDLGYVLCDARQFEQMILNLAANAQEAMPRGGVISIQTDRETVAAVPPDLAGEMRPGDYVTLTFADNGRGMDAETRAHCFEPFFSTKKVGRGPGLGLSTVYGIVRQHGGHVRVESRSEPGTAFKFWFPASLIAPDPPAVETGGASPRGTEELLVVEDDPFVREMVRQALTNLGYRVACAENGEAALARVDAKAAAPALLVTDVVMPGINGRELHARLATRRPRLKVLYMSGYSEETVSHHGVLDAGLQFLPKPFTLRELARRVRTLLDA